MRAVVQRVSRAGVAVDGKDIAETGKGLLVLLGVCKTDSEKQARYLADKIVHLRIFEDQKGKMNLSLLDVGGELMVVSQFTLYGDCRKGRRPSFVEAAGPEKAENLYEAFVRMVRDHGVTASTGRFRAMMDVFLVNQGPVTLILDSP